jgi:Ser/Thr protein kinase RdoA (MazF antagonist)
MKEIYLPVYSSILSSQGLEKILMENYNLGHSIKITVLSIGDNDHYLVESETSKYVLRVYRYNKNWLQRESDYIFELEWLLFLKNKGISIAYPIQRKDGAYIGTLSAPEGMRYWALFTLANGNGKLRLSSKNCYKYGEIISRIHIISNDFKSTHKRIHIDQNFLVYRPIERVTPHLDHNKKQYPLALKAFAEEFEIEIKQFTARIKKDEWGIIGGDFHGYNHFLKPNGELVLFDFDFCGYGWRAYDLAVFKWSLFGVPDVKKIKNCQALWDAFLEGYSINRCLSKEELSIIPTFVKARQVFIMDFHTSIPHASLDNKYWSKMFFGLKNGAI